MTSHELLRVFSEIKKTGIGDHYLYLFHDSHGRITGLLNPENNRYPLLAKQLVRSGNLSQYYDLSGLADSGECQRLVQRTRFEREAALFTFFTSVPRTTLFTQRLENGLYFGRISFYDFSPNLGSQSVCLHILTDTNHDRLLGFTEDFQRLHAGVYPNAENLINLPLSALLSPTPGEFQRRMWPSLTASQLAAFPVVYSKDFLKEGPGVLEELPAGGVLERRAEGLYWESRDQRYSFLTVLKEINTETQDFVFALSLRNLSGRGPQFLLGGRYQGEEHLPDDFGYMAGRTAAGEPGIVLKKHGFPAVVSGDPGLPSRETTLWFCKIGACVLLFQDQTRLQAFYDSDFYPNAAAFITVEMRRGDSCLLTRAELRVRPAETRERPRRYMANFVHQPQRYFLLDRYYNYDLASPYFGHLAGYLLNDISEMQDKLITLDRQYRDEFKSGQKLKSLLLQYRREEDFVGSAGGLALIKETARTVARSHATVLLEGETGTGKEMLARYIHDSSGRREGPFVKVDCSTVPQGLIESHLFGHEKGAFTGAVGRSLGMLEKADKGTLFLDEVGNLNAETQAKLLQFLNDFTLTRIGGTAPIKVDVRCIVASNVSLEERVKAGAFREDLYYRMNVVSLRMPPLRKRIEDLPALCNRFLAQYCPGAGRKIDGFSPQALKKLSKYSWPGNVRELKNVVERAAIFSQGDFIAAEDIQLPRGSRVSPRVREERSRFYLSLTRREDVEAALMRHSGNVTAAAAHLGLSRAAFYVFMRREGIRAKNFRQGFKGQRNQRL